MRKPLGALTKNVAIYGAGDVAVAVVNLVLLRWYLLVLSEADYGALAYLVLFVPVVIFGRWVETRFAWRR